MQHRIIFALLVIAGIMAACSSPAAPAAPAPAAPVARANSPVSSPASTAQPTTKELQAILANGKRLLTTQEAVQKGDVTAARTSFKAFNDAWSSTEVYVKARSVDLYGGIEDVQKQVNRDLLDAERPALTVVTAELAQLRSRYDEAAKLSEMGRPLHPMLDDLAALRGERVHLRNAQAALRTKDVASANAAFALFESGWPAVTAVVRTNAGELETGIDEARKVISAGLSAPSPSADTLLPQVDAFIAKITEAVNKVNAALPTDARY